ncbi:MAG: hypothetical protein AAGA56_28695 [Myxococcota bacterium]
MKLPDDWREFIELLHAHEVDFVVVGAHALAANGRPRATQAIDFFVSPTVANAERLGHVLRAFGFAALADESHLFAEPGRMASLGNPPLRIDVMNATTGVSFEEAMAGAIEARFDGLLVPFLGAAQLRANKLASGRPKDLLDIALLDEMDDA